MGDILQRFWEKVEKTESCWLWTANKTKDGYGKITINYKTIASHRFSYELVKNKIPKGLELDHLCRNPSCVNPDHLEPVTHKENVRRGNHAKGKNTVNGKKTHCPKGHEYTEENIYYYKTFRQCGICRKHSNNIKRCLN